MRHKRIVGLLQYADCIFPLPFVSVIMYTGLSYIIYETKNFVAKIFIAIMLFIIAFICFCVLYIICRLAIKFIYLVRRPIGCKILYLRNKNNKQQICMKPIYYKDKEQFLKDFETIICYANKKGYKQIETCTHRIIVYKLLDMYIKSSNKISRKTINSMEVGYSINVETSIGLFTIKRLNDIVNVAARYEYKKIMTWKQFKRTFNKVKYYNIVIRDIKDNI